MHGKVFVMTNLDMSYSDFEKIPAAVCGLSNLRSFKVNYTPNVSKYNGSIFEECTHTIPSVTDLWLEYDHMTKVPNLAIVYPNLDKLFFSHNDLHFIESDTFAGMTSLTLLDLSFNHLSRIPFAGNATLNIGKLYLADNDIH